MEKLTVLDSAMQSPSARLRALLDEPRNGVTTGSVGRGVGRAASTVSQYANPEVTYPGDVADMDDRVAAWLNRYDQRKGLPRRPPFVQTSVAEDLQATLKIAHVEGDMAFAYGPSGCGKTWACRDYAARERDVILMTVIRGQGHIKAACLALAHALGIKADRKVGKRSISRGQAALVEEIFDALGGSGRLLVFDDADYLNADTLDFLRQLHDATDVPIAFVGMLDCFERIRDSRRHEQIWNRIGTVLRLPHISKRDAAKILAGVHHDAVDACWAGSQQCARRLVKGYMRAKRIADRELVQPKHVQAAYEMQRIA